MLKFLFLQDLHDHIWPMAVAENLATDMTGVSLPILDFSGFSEKHPYEVNFMLYYSIPNISEANQITRPYSIVSINLQRGELIKIHKMRAKKNFKTDIGSGVRNELLNLSNNERRSLQELFFIRYNEAALLYAGEKISPEQAKHLNELHDLFNYFIEPHLRLDYGKYGQHFFDWLNRFT